MKSYLIFKPVIHLFVLAIISTAGLVTPARAVDMMNTRMVSISSLAAPPVAAPVGTNLPEKVVFSGQARVKSRRVLDPDFGEPKIILFIDMSGISGLGSSSGATYVVASQEILIQPLAASQKLEIIFPFAKSMADPLPLVRTGVASFALNVDVNTGVVTAASGTAISR
jgi:hypothetical protein